MQKINFTKEQVPFTQVANVVAQLESISFKARGIYAYMSSKPEGWDFSAERIARDSTDGVKSVRTGLQELVSVGLLQRTKLANGRVEDKLFIEPKAQNGIVAQKPKGPNGREPKGQRAETGTISNKEIKKERVKKIKKIAKASPLLDSKAQFIVDIIHAMERIDVKNKRYYGNKTQRQACEFLLKEYGLSQTISAIEVYVALKPKNLKYFPEITSPYELVEKWKKLEGFMNRKIVEQNEVASNFV